MSAKFFLVTGGSGFIGIHVINQLVKHGFKVRTTVRNVNDPVKVEPIKMLEKYSKYPIDIVQADLLDANCWKEALKDITNVIHVASPLLVNEPKDENLEYIQPALQGTLNVMEAAIATPTVVRVVLTSSGLTIFGNDFDNKKIYSEKDWAEYENLQNGYTRSKFLAEKAAWKFVEDKKKNNEPCFELAVIHPVLVMGPLLHSTLGTSATKFLSIFEGKVEKVPDLYFPICDVRGYRIYLFF